MKKCIQSLWLVNFLLFVLSSSLQAQLGSNSKLGSNKSSGAKLTTGALPPALPGGQKSVSLPGNPVSITFSNQTGSTVSAFWVDFNGLNQSIGTLFPSQAVQITTYPGHITVFMANGKQVATYKATSTANASAFAIVGSNPSPSGSSAIPKPATTIPNGFQIRNGQLSSAPLTAPQNSRNNIKRSNIGNFIRSLLTPVPSKNNFVPSPNNPGVATSNQFSNPVKRNTGGSNLANILANLAANRGNASPLSTGGSAAVGPRVVPTKITSTGSKMTPQQAQAMVDFHNRVRAEVGVGPVTWDPAIAAFAQGWADKITASGNMQHNPNRKLGNDILGENIAWSSQQGGDPYSVSEGWYSTEKSKYRPGTPANSNPGAGHYTQMIWRSSNKIGAGVGSGATGTYVVCNYNPAGNVGNQKPY